MMETHMNRKLMMTALVLATALSAPVLAAATSNAPPPGNANEAQALKVAESKLDALAKEVSTDWAATSPPPEKVVDKKPPHRVAKKRHVKARHKVQAKPVAVVKPKILGRRLTKAEVQETLAGTRDFAGCDLSGLNLVGMDLTGVKFNRANLHLANLGRANLDETDLELADLTGADLRGASLNQARLRGTRMDGAKIEGALWTDKTVCRKGSVGGCIE
jgi:uncharacterized protein YjbI with pentapeptide repeats